jgi:hypothetical protein
MLPPSIENVDKSQKSERSRRNSRYGWKLLAGFRLLQSLGGAMTIAREIELYNSAYSLAWKHVSELRKREKPNIASRLHDSIRSQIKMGATEPLFIASEALRDVEFNPETWD